MTVVSRRIGALGPVAVILSAIAACGEYGAPAPDTAGATPGGKTLTDEDGDPLIADLPPDPLCVLAGPPSRAPGDVLVYSEEFDGRALDPMKWNIASGYKGHDAIENTSSPDNAVVANGLLQVRTARNPSDAEHPYVSGLLDSLGKFARTYGRVEFKARFPYAAGVWYAIWGRPWSQPFPEIDVEVVNRPGHGKTELYFVNHWAAPPLPAAERRSFVMKNTIDVATFHTYSLLWKPGSFEWQVDGVKQMEAEPRGVPDLPVYWVINGWVGGWVGSPTETTPFPATFEVDYLRVYRVDGLVADPVIKVFNRRPEYAKSEKVEVALANFDEACAHVEMYDGATLVRTASTRPLLFSMSRLRRGPHTLTFVATDGARRTTATLETVIK